MNKLNLLPLWEMATAKNQARIQLEEIEDRINRWFKRQFDEGLLSSSDIEELKEKIGREYEA